MASKAFSKGDSAWCIKYGTAEGTAYRYTVARDSGLESSYVFLISPGSMGGSMVVDKTHCFTDLDSAVTGLKAMAAKKVKSLQKQVKKLQGLEFKEHVVS